MMQVLRPAKALPIARVAAAQVAAAQRVGLRRRLLLLVSLVALSALPLLLLMPLFDAPFERDQGLYSVIARGWREGSVPYRDLWDNKGAVPFPWYLAAPGPLGGGG